MIFLSIRDIVVEFANRYGLNTWDWFALSITLITLIVSSISLVVACKTLKSQKKTEQNTAPIITPEILEQLSREYIKTYYSALYDLLALNFALIKTNYRTKPSHRFWSRFRNPNDYLFESLYYDDWKKFTFFKHFTSVNQDYKKGIDRLELLLEEEASAEEIEQEFSILYGYVLDISWSWMVVLFDCFEQRKDVIIVSLPFIHIFSYSIRDWLIEECDSNDINNEVCNKKTSLGEKQQVIFETLRNPISLVSYNLVLVTKNFSLFDCLRKRNMYKGKPIDEIENIMFEQASSSITDIILDRLNDIIYEGRSFTSYIFVEEKQEQQKPSFKKRYLYREEERSQYILFDRTKLTNPT